MNDGAVWVELRDPDTNKLICKVDPFRAIIEYRKGSKPPVRWSLAELCKSIDDRLTAYRASIEEGISAADEFSIRVSELRDKLECGATNESKNE